MIPTASPPACLRPAWVAGVCPKFLVSLTILVLAGFPFLPIPPFARLAKEAGAELTGRAQRGLKDMQREEG